MTKRYGHPMFYELLEQMADLHSRKNHDYAGEADPLSNLRECEKIGIPAWKGVIVRLQDKWKRLTNFALTDTLKVKDESFEDTLIDNAVYSVLCVVLWRESKKTTGEPYYGSTVVDLTDHFKPDEIDCDHDLQLMNCEDDLQKWACAKCGENYPFRPDGGVPPLGSKK